MHEKTEITLSPPYYINSAPYLGKNTYQNDIGDLLLSLGYYLIDTVKEKKFAHRLIAGVGKNYLQVITKRKTAPRRDTIHRCSQTQALPISFYMPITLLHIKTWN